VDAGLARACEAGEALWAGSEEVAAVEHEACGCGGVTGDGLARGAQAGAVEAATSIQNVAEGEGGQFLLP
jgi:hypothetical protein